MEDEANTIALMARLVPHGAEMARTFIVAFLATGAAGLALVWKQTRLAREDRDRASLRQARRVLVQMLGLAESLEKAGEITSGLGPAEPLVKMRPDLLYEASALSEEHFAFWEAVKKHCLHSVDPARDASEIRELIKAAELRLRYPSPEDKG